MTIDLKIKENPKLNENQKIDLFQSTLKNHDNKKIWSASRKILQAKMKIMKLLIYTQPIDEKRRLKKTLNDVIAKRSNSLAKK